MGHTRAPVSRAADWVRGLPDRLARATDRLSGRLGLSTTGWLGLAAAVVTMALASVGLAAVSEDVLTHGGLSLSDADNLQLFINHRSPELVGAARAASQIGSVAVLVALAVVAAGLLWWRGARLAVAAAPVLSLGVAGAIVAVAKPMVARPRPAVGLRLVTETEPSFPSGHATDATALFIALGVLVAVVVLRRPIARLLVVAGSGLAAAAVGLSRLVLGVHWPTDVLAGWSLGLLVAVAVCTVVLLLPGPPAEPASGSSRWAQLRWRVARLLNAARPSTPGATTTG